MAEAVQAEYEDDEEFEEYEELDSVSTLGAIVFAAILGAGIGAFVGSAAASVLGLIIAVASEHGGMMLLALMGGGAAAGGITGFAVGTPIGSTLGLISELRWSRLSLPVVGAALAAIAGLISGIGGGMIVAFALSSSPQKVGLLGAVIGLVAGILGGFVLGLFTKAQLELREDRLERYRAEDEEEDGEEEYDA